MLVYIQCIVLLQGFDIQRFPASSWALGSPSTSIGWRAKWPYGLIGWWDASCHWPFVGKFISSSLLPKLLELPNSQIKRSEAEMQHLPSSSGLRESWPRAGAFTEIGTKPSFAETSSRPILRLLGSLVCHRKVCHVNKKDCLFGVDNDLACTQKKL